MIALRAAFGTAFVNQANQQPLFWAEVEFASQTFFRAILIGRDHDPFLWCIG
jgi:hypothetical protein